MTKLVRNIIIGGGSTVAVAGGATGAAIAVTNKKSSSEDKKLSPEQVKAQLEQKWTATSSDVQDFLVKHQGEMLSGERTELYTALGTFMSSEHTTESIYTLQQTEEKIQHQIEDRKNSAELSKPENAEKFAKFEGKVAEEELNAIKTVAELDALVAKYQ